MNGRISWLGVALIVRLSSWVTLIIMGIIFGIGLSWSLLRARVTGQVEVD